MKVLVIGGGAREHALCQAIKQSEEDLYAVMSNLNPGIKKLAKDSDEFTIATDLIGK